MAGFLLSVSNPLCNDDVRQNPRHRRYSLAL